MSRPRLVHLTTTDISLSLLLGPQLRAFAAAGYEVIGVSAPANLPAPVLTKLHAAIQTSLEDPALVTRLNESRMAR